MIHRILLGEDLYHHQNGEYSRYPKMIHIINKIMLCEYSFCYYFYIIGIKLTLRCTKKTINIKHKIIVI
jgi:hypothetical protein